MFGTFDAPMIETFAGTGPEALRLSEQVQDAWVSFARRGDPSTEARGSWPRYDPSTRPTMILGEQSRIERGPRADEPAIWV